LYYIEITLHPAKHNISLSPLLSR